MILTIYSVIIIIFLFLIYYFFIRKNYFFLIISFFVSILVLFLTFSYINVVIAIISENIAIDIMKGIGKALIGNCAECCPIEDTTKSSIPVLDMIRQQVDCNALEVFKDSNRNMVGSGEFSTVLDPKTGKIFSRICLGSNEVNALVNKNSIPLPFRGSVISHLQNKCFCYETSSQLKEAFDSIKDIIKK
jgi:hypothetical protein